MALLDFFSTTFLIHLAITVLIVGTVSIYFIQKINVQNHKINSMLELVTTMAEELKRTQSLLTIGSSVPISFGNNYPLDNTTFNEIIQLGEKKDLINVSDDEDEYNEEDEEDEDEDEDEDDEDEDEYEDEDEDEEDEDEEDEDEEDEELLDIKTINIGETTENILDSSENDEKNNDDITNLEEITHKVLKKTINLEDLEGPKSIDILDYKKVSLNKLKSILVEKGIVTDASKLKKNEILKLLEVE
jgi:hypothetical protein